MSTFWQMTALHARSGRSQEVIGHRGCFRHSTVLDDGNHAPDLRRCQPLPDSLDHSCGVFVQGVPVRPQFLMSKPKLQHPSAGGHQSNDMAKNEDEMIRAGRLRYIWGRASQSFYRSPKQFLRPERLRTTPSTPTASRSSQTVLFPSVAGHPA